jgi:hypothetical protein
MSGILPVPEGAMAECQNKEKNEAKCNCAYTSCERHGVCCECVRYHIENGGTPACLRK